MRQNIEEEIAKEQAGFCRRRGTRDQISNLRLLSEKFRERKKQLFLCFIDYRKAFDCVCHEELWEILTRLNFPKHLIGLVESLYKQQLSSVRTIHGKTDWFHNGRGVRQDCILLYHHTFLIFILNGLCGKRWKKMTVYLSVEHEYQTYVTPMIQY